LLEKIGRSFLVAGGVSLSIYAIPTVYGAVMARVAVAQFRSQSAEHKQWNSSRIMAYEHALTVSFAPPEAILRVPKVGIEAPLLEGTSEVTLNRGVGHIPGTALPGEPGNLAIAGHRDGFFRALKDVGPGDIIEIQRPRRPGDAVDASGPVDRYVVRHIKTVAPSDTSVLSNTDGSTLTLITCYPFYYLGAAPQRYVVQASLLSASAP
jgi:sortase A